MTEQPVVVTLKPCPNPWCESHTHENGGPKAPDDLWTIDGSNSVRVGCHFCEMLGPIRATEAEAIAAWNTRLSTEAEKTKAVEERECGECGAIVVAGPESMWCHCRIIPWPIRSRKSGG